MSTSFTISLKPSNVGLRVHQIKKVGAGRHQTLKGRTRKGKFRRIKVKEIGYVS